MPRKKTVSLAILPHTQQGDSTLYFLSLHCIALFCYGLLCTPMDCPQRCSIRVLPTSDASIDIDEKQFDLTKFNFTVVLGE